jgi:hypothetical protein
MKKALSISTCLVLLSGCGNSEPTLDVTISPSPHYSGQYIVTAAVVTDEIVIKQVSINRGNCKSGSPIQSPKTLKFGQTLDTYVTSCKVKEITYETSMGEETFTFD